MRAAGSHVNPPKLPLRLVEGPYMGCRRSSDVKKWPTPGVTKNWCYARVVRVLLSSPCGHHTERSRHVDKWTSRRNRSGSRSTRQNRIFDGAAGRHPMPSPRSSSPPKMADLPGERPNLDVPYVLFSTAHGPPDADRTRGAVATCSCGVGDICQGPSVCTPLLPSFARLRHSDRVPRKGFAKVGRCEGSSECPEP